MVCAGVAPAQAVSPVAPDAPADAPAYDPAVAAPGPDDMTWTDFEGLDAADLSRTMEEWTPPRKDMRLFAIEGVARV
jgi:hypothetical protein